MTTEHWKPREYHFDMDKIGLMLNGNLITVQVDPECGYWIAYFSGYPTEARRGTSEANAVFELLMSLMRKSYE